MNCIRNVCSVVVCLNMKLRLIGRVRQHRWRHGWYATRHLGYLPVLSALLHSTHMLMLMHMLVSTHKVIHQHTPPSSNISVHGSPLPTQHTSSRIITTHHPRLRSRFSGSPLPTQHRSSRISTHHTPPSTNISVQRIASPYSTHLGSWIASTDSTHKLTYHHTPHTTLDKYLGSSDRLSLFNTQAHVTSLHITLNKYLGSTDRLSWLNTQAHVTAHTTHHTRQISRFNGSPLPTQHVSVHGSPLPT